MLRSYIGMKINVKMLNMQIFVKENEKEENIKFWIIIIFKFEDC